MSRVYNFSAGPSMLPEAVLSRAAAEMFDCGGSGQSVMEMSHRSPEYEKIIFGCEELLRKIMNIPSSYKILFMQGGASNQFSAVPLNLLSEEDTADYAITGSFAKKAYQEAKRFSDVSEIASSADKNFTYIPAITPSMLNPDAKYLHICFNNTIYGTCYQSVPETGGKDLVADMSSCILSTPVDVSRFGIIYAGAQKNMAPAGLTVAIIREDLIGHARSNTPIMLNYKTFADNDSMYNTPPCYPIYICKLVLEWLQNDIGGLENMESINRKKASLLYDYLDNSKLFIPIAEKPYRSIMNVTFRTGDDRLDKEFVEGSAAFGIVNIKGHRLAGGMRASIYNAMPYAGVETLIEYMSRFEAAHK